MRMHNPPHPGEVLKELYLEPLGLSVTDVAKGLGITRKSLSEILNKHTGISTSMALRLAEAFDTTPEHWLNLQQEYDLWKTQREVKTQKIVHFYFASSNSSRKENY